MLSRKWQKERKYRASDVLVTMSARELLAGRTSFIGAYCIVIAIVAKRSCWVAAIESSSLEIGWERRIRA
jgi:hypothetical protein